MHWVEPLCARCVIEVRCACAAHQTRQFKSRIPTAVEDRSLVESDDHWVLVDCGVCVVHLFTPEGRERYRFEQMIESRPTLDELYAREIEKTPTEETLEGYEFQGFDESLDDTATPDEVQRAQRAAKSYLFGRRKRK